MSLNVPDQNSGAFLIQQIWYYEGNTKSRYGEVAFMKTKGRLISAAISVMLIFTMFLCGSDQMAFAAQNEENSIAYEKQSPEKSRSVAKRTIMLYDCGSDLESGGKMASYNLRQILSSSFSSNEEIRFIVMTGGADKWHLEKDYLEFPDDVYVPDDAVEEQDPEDEEVWNVADDNKSRISNVYNQIWEAQGIDAAENAGKMVLLDGDGVLGDGEAAKRSKIAKSDCDEYGFLDLDNIDHYEWMNDPEVLKAFIDYCVEEAPAEKYDLILWDHGLGPKGGFCCNEQEYEGGFDSMTVDKLMDALSDNKVVDADGDGSQDGTFDMVDFDACLMGSAEVTMAIGDYMDYLIVSPKTEPGYGQYYGPHDERYTGWLDLLGSDPDHDTFDLGKTIVDDYIAFYDKEEGPGSAQEGTLAVIDTNQLLNNAIKFDGEEYTFAKALSFLTNNLQGDLHAGKYYDEFRSFKSSIEYNGFAYYDLGNLVSQLAYGFDDLDQQDLEDGSIDDTNRYTDLAYMIMDFLNDESIVYARGTKGIHTKEQYYRIRNGEMKYGEQGTSGIHIAFDTLESPVITFQAIHGEYPKMISKLKEAHPDRAEFLEQHLATMEMYGLAYLMGRTVTEMVTYGTPKDEIDYDAVMDYCDHEGERDDFDNVVSRLYIEALGGEQLNKGWISHLIGQMRDEVVMEDQIRVQSVKTEEGTGYSITFNDVLKQAIDNVQMNLVAELPAAEEFINDPDNEEYLGIFSFMPSDLTVGSVSGSEVYDVDPERDGYEALIEWLLTPGSKWDLKPMEEKWYAFRYGDGKIAIAGAEDYDREFEVPTGYFTTEYRDVYDFETDEYVPTLQKVCNLVYLIFAKDNNGGCELSEIAIRQDSGGFRFIPVSEFEGELEVQPMLEVKDDFCKTYIPISDTYIKLNKETLKDIRLEYVDIKDIPDIKDTDGDGRATHNTVTVANIYGYELDITDQVRGISNISGAKVVLSNKSFTYNGKVHRPSIRTIGGKKLKEGTDYTVKWSNAGSKNVGTYTVTVKGKGKYKGTTKATYKINPKGTGIKGLASAKRVITVRWNKQSAKMSGSRITGYQIQLATDSKFKKNVKKVTVKGCSKVSKKVTKLKGGKKYYVRIRTYKKINGRNYYSPWSKVKTAKTK